MHCTTLISMIINIFIFAAIYSNLWSKISIFHALRINFSNFRECKILENFSSFARRAHSLAANMKFSHLNLLSGNDFKRELYQLPISAPHILLLEEIRSFYILLTNAYKKALWICHIYL